MRKISIAMYKQLGTCYTPEKLSETSVHGEDEISVTEFLTSYRNKLSFNHLLWLPVRVDYMGETDLHQFICWIAGLNADQLNDKFNTYIALGRKFNTGLLTAEELTMISKNAMINLSKDTEELNNANDVAVVIKLYECANAVIDGKIKKDKLDEIYQATIRDLSIDKANIAKLAIGCMHSDATTAWQFIVNLIDSNHEIITDKLLAYFTAKENNQPFTFE